LVVWDYQEGAQNLVKRQKYLQIAASAAAIVANSAKIVMHLPSIVLPLFFCFDNFCLSRFGIHLTILTIYGCDFTESCG